MELCRGPGHSDAPSTPVRKSPGHRRPGAHGVQVTSGTPGTRTPPLTPEEPHPCGRAGWSGHIFTWARLFFSERHRAPLLASQVSRAARLPRGRAGSGRPRPARCDVVPLIAGTESHRAGYRGGGAARNRAGDGTAGAAAVGEAPGKPAGLAACSPGIAHPAWAVSVTHVRVTEAGSPLARWAAGGRPGGGRPPPGAARAAARRRLRTAPGPRPGQAVRPGW
jgi:hypothetical protein